jgi:SAM-dependent methyltransferase
MAIRGVNCLVCGAPTEPVLDLGRQPLANLLLERADESYEAYPLGLAACRACSNGQLTHFVDPAMLFRHYLYASGTSNTLKAYFDWFSASLARNVERGGRVLEIACNDGSLLGSLAADGFDVTGVDPAENLSEVARSAGHRVLTGFFPDVSPEGPFDAIIAMNVLAHTPTPTKILDGVKRLLAPQGTAFIQTSQALMLENGEFDTIYHEHYSFFTPASMSRLARANGLKLCDMRLTSIHGGSMVYILRHDGAPAAPFAFADQPAFALPLPDPLPATMSLAFAADDVDRRYGAFATLAREAMARARAHVARHQQKGRELALVGVAAKALTFVRAAGINPDVYVDEAALKIGRFVPGADHPIRPLARAGDLPDDTVFLLGAWNFAAELKSKIVAARSGHDTNFLTVFPEFDARTHKSSCAAS